MALLTLVLLGVGAAYLGWLERHDPDTTTPPETEIIP